MNVLRIVTTIIETQGSSTDTDFVTVFCYDKEISSSCNKDSRFEEAWRELDTKLRSLKTKTSKENSLYLYTDNIAK